MDVWNADVYSQFLDSRTRPARDLLAAIPPSFIPSLVYDLGCGPGNSTILLKERWADATIFGLDSSADMLREAKLTHPDIHFIQTDIADFSPTEKIDFIFANASLQWLDKHDILIPHLVNLLSDNGAIAIQMPNNFHSPSHQVSVKILRNNLDWHHFLEKLIWGYLTEPLYNLTKYYDIFAKAHVSSIQLWETTYYQEMSTYQDIYDWVKGTGLRPVLSLMTEDEQQKFANTYIDNIAKEYPLQINNKVLLPFKRIFMIAYH